MKISYEVTVGPDEHRPNNADGTVEIWTLNGEYHCEHGPAVITRNANKQIISQHWWLNNQRYRENGPAVIYDDGVMHETSWHPAREDGPSRLVKINDLVTEEEWRTPLKKGGFHRIGGPAIIDTDSNTGIVYKESWYLFGKRHREDGPALIERDRQTGQITKQEYYKNGRRMEPQSQAPKITL
uniref:hypothetical protein n=1 Tax=Pararhizobium sp. IMCC3301 TaxID=3067904 RepID=UPI00274158C6|nr:hypothetical protein [Pararhizobium sp. IMCC3301]